MICRSRGPTWLKVSSIALHLIDRAPVAASGSKNQVPGKDLDSGLCVSFCIHAAKARPRVLTKRENSCLARVSACFPWKIAVTMVMAGGLQVAASGSFAQPLGGTT